MTDAPFSIIAEDIVELTVSDIETAQRVAQYLRTFPECSEVVPTRTTVAVMFSPLNTNTETILSLMKNGLSKPLPVSASATEDITLQVKYGGAEGPDLELVARQLDVSPRQLIETHTDQLFVVDLMGFTPGFAYLSELNWSVPRLNTPRSDVAAGSIGLAGRLSGIYSLRGPGGWPIIGQTKHQLFDPGVDPPFLLKPGFRVRFQEINP